MLSLLLLGGSFVFHRIQLGREKAVLTPPGMMISVNEHDMHVLAVGTGDVTCVFISGLGIPAPVLEMKGLYTDMAEDFRVVVVERAGYGYSTSADDSRDIDIVLDETRTVLKAAGEEPPYVLIAHSIGGLEAVYWAQKYPDEVLAIVGLDIGFPQGYIEEGLTDAMRRTRNIQAFLIKCGIHRWIPGAVISPDVLNADFLTAEEKAQYRALAFKNMLNDDMVSELNSVEANAKKSLAYDLPLHTPIRIFLPVPKSDQELNQNADYYQGRKAYYQSFIDPFKDGELIVSVRGDHYIYLDSYGQIADICWEFISRIK